MRIVFLVLGWVFGIAAVFRTLATGYTAWLAGRDDAIGLDVSVGTVIRDHMTYFSWTIDVGEAILPNGFFEWILNFPALIVFPVSAVIAAMLSYGAFRLAGKKG